MELKEVMEELKSLGTERTKKAYINNGAQEPVFGVTISAMKPIFKKLKYNQSLAEQLYATGNYDAMYLAGMIAEPNRTKYAMNNFIMAGGISYLPLHEEAMKIAQEVGTVDVKVMNYHFR
jgi:hypothetical protein